MAVSNWTHFPWSSYVALNLIHIIVVDIYASQLLGIQCRIGRSTGLPMPMYVQSVAVSHQSMVGSYSRDVVLFMSTVDSCGRIAIARVLCSTIECGLIRGFYGV